MSSRLPVNRLQYALLYLCMFSNSKVDTRKHVQDEVTGGVAPLHTSGSV